MARIVIVGGGVVGCAIARELTRYRAEVVVLEKGNDVSVGASKANSGIVHAGFDAKAGTLKAKYNVLGCAMFARLSKELDFPYRNNGSLVLCFSEEEREKLSQLKENGEKNGVQGLTVLTREELQKKEPYVGGNVVAALYAPSAGIVSPYEMTVAYAENAAANGAAFRFEAEVASIIKRENGFTVVAKDGEMAEADVVINAAGLFADEVNSLVSQVKFEISARRGEYCLLDKSRGYLAGSTLFQLPTKMGKGVLVTPTTHGNIMVGPTAEDIGDKTDTDTTYAGLNSVWDKALVTMPDLSQRDIITQFAGLRAHETEGDDFIIGESSDTPGFYNAAGIESPGLSSAPAIAVNLASEIAAKWKLEENRNFVAERRGIPHFSKLTQEERTALIAENPAYGRVVCRCETVTEGEIIEAIRRTPGARDLDGIKRRTRAGMGRCQSGFCCPRVMEILARETNIPFQAVTKGGGASRLLVGRNKRI